MEMRFFLPLVKADEAKHLVYARAAAEEPDKSNEIMDYVTAVPAFKAWSKQYEDATLGKSYGNVRAMHNPRHLAGKVEKLDYDDDGMAIGAMIKVLDPVDWIKVQEGGYTGISIGGGYARKWKDPLNKALTRYTPRIQEISFVDAPCMPSARILEMQKMDGTIEEILLKGTPRLFVDLVPPRTFAEMEKSLLGAAVGAGIGHLAGRAAGRVAARKVATGFALNSIRRRGGASLQDVAEHSADIERAGQIGRRVGSVVGGGAGLALGVHVSRRRDGSIDVAKQTIIDNLSKLKPIEALPLYKSLADLARATGANFSSRGKTFANVAVRRPETGLSAPTPAGRVSVSGGGNTGPAYMSRGKSFMPSPKPPDFQKEDVVDGLLKAVEGKAPATPEAKEKIRQTLHEFKHGALRSYRGVNPRTGRARKGPKVENRQQAIAIALSQARRMGKAEDQLVVNALADRLMKRRAGALIGGAIGATVGAAVTRHPAGALLGGTLGAVKGDNIHAALAERRSLKGRAWLKSTLSEKEHAQRIAAAKARWAGEGHPDIDAHHTAIMGQAKKAILGRAGKIEAAQAYHDRTWHGIADTMEAYDKVRGEMPKGHSLMMEATHGEGLLYNPEGVGEKHFDAKGAPKKPLTLLHPTEADDWIKKHGKTANRVTKETPAGLIEHIDEIFAAAAIEAAA